MDTPQSQLAGRRLKCLYLRQIENASRIAGEYGWDIEYIRDNTMTLAKIESGGYDFVYTSNGVHVCIRDLVAMYKDIYRELSKTDRRAIR